MQSVRRLSGLKPAVRDQNDVRWIAATNRGSGFSPG
jgi:hypothetical protein